MPISNSNSNPYLEGIYAPTETEMTCNDLEVIGEIPKDLAGIFARNGPNPRYKPRGRYHWFDGDGMIHALRILDGKATYTNRWIQSPHYQQETEAGRPLWGGLMEPFSENPQEAPFKDTANTDVYFHNDTLKAVWYLSGDPISIDPLTLVTRGTDTLGGKLHGKVSAHPKVDGETGELLYFDYGMRPPFMHYGEVSKDGILQNRIPVPLPGPRLPHDMAFTKNYAILMDLPVFYNLEALKKNRWKSEFHPEISSRFALIPRRGKTEEIRWFEAESCYIYHSVNAWEQADEIIMVGCRVDHPINSPRQEDGKYAQMMANLRVKARLCRWRFNLTTGQTKEESLDDHNTEFPSINLEYLGKPSKYSYNMKLAETPTLLFDGINKYQTDNGSYEDYLFGPGLWGSEAPFAPRLNATSEDDGYLLSFVRGGPDDISEVQILDAQNISQGPVARIRTPHPVPIGFHATWVAQSKLETI